MRAKHHIADKVLLQGTLVNFGSKHVSVKRAERDFELQPQDIRAITFEITKFHCPDWSSATQNPIRVIWKSIEKSKSKVVATWSRRFFQGKRVVAPSEAASWHCFGPVLESDLEQILRQSGTSGIFVTPKSVSGAVDGFFRVVWLQTNDLQQSATVAKATSNVLGLVKSRSNLGLRLHSSNSALVRKAVEVEPDWQNDMGIRYQVKVASKYVMAPTPQATDRESL